MNQQDETLLKRLDIITSEITNYARGLADDSYHKQWFAWTARMEEICDLWDEAYTIIGQLEEHSVARRNDKIYNGTENIRRLQKLTNRS